ncbi:RNA polymerase subunit RPABC4/transcription elongation factor Spt4/magnesium-transporting ATPase (P-type) [Pullulanibacillus pueri]|uniref:Zinc-ribbon domain-containing protein n=1 Tax=Pullulanibacillus pueri TaxID=1437324 RepID=A0A8J3EN63_9BACL|nr:zinc ribbon domain-containing protein [Pullulanibacillus pueri]MBM7683714.1 RNA polymerase subunit RPABC4/transcription elongation factor Spt4/magnesium-transporting ATPase (P-type) [Pullulanibacillus pueri]GGH85189.1 hypothetical protein GCM10007096_30000 [Pullulanibacillus pueri]
MNCSNCKQDIPNDAKFCPHCGIEYSTHEHAASSDVEPSNIHDRQQPSAPHPNIVKATTFINAYWAFFIDSLKSPTPHGETADKKHYIYGYVTFGLFSIIYGFIFFFMTRPLHSFSLYVYQDSFSFSKTFFPALFLMILITLMTVLIIWGVTRILLHVNVSFHDVVGRFGAFSTLYLALAVIALILSIPRIYGLLALFLVLMLLVYLSSIFAVVYSYKKQSKTKVDPLYATLIVYGVLFIILALFWNRLALYIGMNML